MIRRSSKSHSDSGHNGYRIGLDVGSISVNAVLIGPDDSVLEDHYVRTHGQPVESVLVVLKDIFSRTGPERVVSMVFTGSGGKLLSSIFDVGSVNEIVAQGAGTTHLCPEVRTVIEMGGEDSKLLLLDTDPVTGRPRVKDFAMNTICAAGTGSFLDQQAIRLGVSIEEFARLAAAKRPDLFGSLVLVNPSQSTSGLADMLLSSDGPSLPTRSVEERAFPSRIHDPDFVEWLTRAGRSGARGHGCASRESRLPGGRCLWDRGYRAIRLHPRRGRGGLRSRPNPGRCVLGRARSRPTSPYSDHSDLIEPRARIPL